jgi:tetratricopeptide (TPR) repeat protein
MWGTALVAVLLMQAVDYNAEGWKALESKDYAAAVQLFAKAVEANPKDYAALFNLALSYSLSGKEAEAIPVYRKVLELKPGLYEAELNLGILLLKQNKPDEAATLLQAAATSQPMEFRPVFYLAEALFAGGRYSNAVEAFQRATERDPKSAEAQLGLARSLAKQKKLDEAAQYFRKAAALDGTYKDALLELAALYEQAGRPQEAIALYTQFPNDVGAREHLGELLLEAQRPAEAVPHLEWAVGKSPTTANRLALATAYLKANQPEKGLSLLAGVVKDEPNNNELRLLYGRELRDQKKYAAAAAEFAKVTEAAPALSEAWSELAAMLILLENYPSALAALDHVRALGAEKAGHVFYRAVVLDKLHQTKLALESYEKFLAISQGKSPDHEFQARQRIRTLRRELERR